jgi:hypothetical protein
MTRRTAMALAMLALSSTSPGLACSCAPLSFDQVVARVPVVFAGSVRSVSASIRKQQSVADVSVQHWIKGVRRNRIRVVTALDSTMCGYPMSTGRTYTFAGSLDRRGRLATDMCLMVPLNDARRRPAP